MLTRIADPISQYEQLLDSSRITEEGKFDLRCWTNYPMLVTLEIENYSQSFYVEPGKDYNVTIPRFDWNIDETRNVFLDPEPLPLVFKNIEPSNINLLIDSIDGVIADYISENTFYFDFKFKPSSRHFDTLAMKLNAIKTDNDFVNRYKTYQLAQMKYLMHLDSRKNLIDEYIRNSPILYYDENYMSLFASLYSNSISKGTKEIPVQRLAHWVYNLDVETYIDSIGTDPLLRHEQIRELAALQALHESFYNSRYYDSEMVVKMIERLASRTKFAEHKTIAGNILKAINRASTESEKGNAYTLPSLIDVNRQKVSLDSLRGRWLYIAFVRVNDPFCISEIETMAHQKEKAYSESDSVEFITISCDREFQKMFHFLKNTKHKGKYDWLWLHFNGDYELLKHFQVTTFPWFVLIAPDGSLRYDITPAPSSGFLLNAPWKSNKMEDDSQRKLFRN